MLLTSPTRILSETLPASFRRLSDTSLPDSMLIVPGLSCRFWSIFTWPGELHCWPSLCRRRSDYFLPLLHNESVIHPLFTWMPFCLVPIGELAVLVYAQLFMVDASIPSQYVLFLQQLMPKKEISEIPSSIGHFRHGKTYFYRTQPAYSLN